MASSQQRAAEANGLARISNISASEIMISQAEIVAELAEIQREVAALRARTLLLPHPLTLTLALALSQP